MDDMAYGMGKMMIFLFSAAACASLGVGAAVGSHFVNRTHFAGRPLPRMGFVGLALLTVGASALSFLIFFGYVGAASLCGRRAFRDLRLDSKSLPDGQAAALVERISIASINGCGARGSSSDLSSKLILVSNS